MSKTVLAQVDGFTPIIDSVAADVGIIGAAIFGRMWRYCQMENGVCHAALGTIASELHLSIRTVIRYSDLLVERGYLKDMTPDLRNEPHTYADTGKAAIRIDVIGMTQSHSGYDRKSQPGMTESHLKKEYKKVKDISGKKPNKQRDPLLDHLAIIAYRDHARLTPNQDQREEIARRVGDKIEQWTSVVKDWMLAGYKPGNVAGMLDAFENGGLKKRFGNQTQLSERVLEFTA